jgi:hypothetical protein
MQNFKTSGDLTQDLAARKIQYAYRLHLMRKRYQSMNKQLAYKPSTSSSNAADTINKKERLKKEKEAVKLKEALLTTHQPTVNDEYNFINIYKKRANPVIEYPNGSSQNNGANDKAQPKAVNNNLSNVSNSSAHSSSSSSSDSTSLSKYISNKENQSSNQNRSSHSKRLVKVQK